jgi:hypothetical protein
MIHGRHSCGFLSLSPDPFKLREVPGEEDLSCPSAREQVEDDGDDGEDEEQVNPGSDGVYANYSQQPQYEQDHGDRPKHTFLLEGCPAIAPAVGL